MPAASEGPAGRTPEALNPWLNRGDRKAPPRDPLGLAMRAVIAAIVQALKASAKDADDAGIRADETRVVLAGTAFMAGLSIGTTIGTDDVAAARAVRDWLISEAMDDSEAASRERERLAGTLRRAVWESKAGGS